MNINSSRIEVIVMGIMLNTREIAEEYRLTHWANIMRECEESGLSIKRFCERKGMHENRYFYWRRKLREMTCSQILKQEGAALQVRQEGCSELTTIQDRTSNQILPVFTEVKLATQPASGIEKISQHNNIKIEGSGVQITAGSEYPIDKLAELLKVVMRQC